MNRRWSVLSALLATALLLWCMPGLVMRQFHHIGRTDDRLRPPKIRMLVVWVTSWLEEDRQLIPALCAAFEKQEPGIRVYLRLADSEELYSQDAVLPDVLLYGTGDVLSPETALLPMPGDAKGQTSACSSGGKCYGVPLWYSPLVLSVPSAWLQPEQSTDDANRRNESSYFAASTRPPPLAQEQLTMEGIPWRRIAESGQLIAREGVGLMSLLAACPPAVRQTLAALKPVIGQAEGDQAMVCSQYCHERRQDAVCVPLSPAVAQRVRYVSLCKQSEEAQAFVRFLSGEDAQQQAAQADLAPLALGNADEANRPFLPNAFQLSLSAIDQLCIQAYLQGDDPVTTLLRLR